MSGGGGSSGGTTTQIVQNYSPEEVARRTRLQDEAERLYQGTKGLYGSYPGARPIAPSPYTQVAEQYMLGLVPGQAASAQNMQRAVDFGLGDVLYAESNPYLQSYMQAAIRPITQSYVDPGGVMSQIRNEATATGQYGGSRQGIAEGVAAGRYAQAIGDELAKIANEGYRQGLDTFSRTMALAPTAMQATYTPAQTLSMVGASEEGRASELENYLANQRAWNMSSQWIPLQNYANMIYGGGSSGGIVTGTAPGMTTGQRLLGAMGGGLAGYTLGAGAAGDALAGALGLGAGALAAPLGILGALAGAGLFR